MGRKALRKEIPLLREKYQPDFIIANVDNLTSGRGAIEKHIHEMREMGVDIMCGGDHIFDNFVKVQDYLEKDDSCLLRFANLWDESTPWAWYKIFEKNGKKILVIHLQWTVFMPHNVKNPHLVAKEILQTVPEEKYDAVIIDMHKETASEGYGLAYFLEWKVSFIYGTHTHIQTNDDTILENGTGILSDVGMNGPAGSVIWATFESVKSRFITGIQKWKIEQKIWDKYIISGVYVEIDETKKCAKIEKIRREKSF